MTNRRGICFPSPSDRLKEINRDRTLMNPYSLSTEG